MSTPDPKTVRDFARRAILSSAEDVDYCGIGEQFGDEEAWPNEESAYEAMLAAVYAEQQKATVTVEWPDEQQPADPVTAEQQQDGAVGRDLTYRVTQAYRAARFMRLDEGALIQGIVTAVLAERTALAGRVAELEGEREADTRAVGSLLEADDEDVPRARKYLRSRFADRIDALIKRDDAKAGESP